MSAAVNQLIAAAIAHREAVRSGQGPSHQKWFLDAVDAYLAQRSPLDRARDDFLVKYPNPDALVQAVTMLGRLTDVVYAATIAEGGTATSVSVDDTPLGVAAMAQACSDAHWSPTYGPVCPIHAFGCPRTATPGR